MSIHGTFLSIRDKSKKKKKKNDSIFGIIFLNKQMKKKLK